MPLDHQGAVAQHHQRRDGAEASGFQVYGWAVIDLTIDDRVHQAHHFRRQLGHGGRRNRVVTGTIVALPEFVGGLVQIIASVFGLVVRAHGVSRLDTASRLPTRLLGNLPVPLAVHPDHLADVVVWMEVTGGDDDVFRFGPV